MNIDILVHFEETIHVNGIRIFKLREEEKDIFYSKLPQPFRSLYLSDADLDWRVQNFGSTRQEEIIEKIPDNPVLQSGEFAEILCYYLIPEKYLPDSDLRPPKWKWKESKNNPAHFTDVVIFHQIDKDNPNPNDSLIAIESKARASRPVSTESALQKAINDSQKDSVSRLAESMFHLKTRYKDDKNVEAVKKLERFMDVVKFPTFLKHFKAIATVDHLYSDVHISNVTIIPDDIKDSFEVILIQITDLQVAYQTTFSKMQLT